MLRAGVPVLSVEDPSQFAQLVGNTSPEILMGISQAARRLRLGGQIVVAQVGVGPELSTRRLRK